MKLAHFIKIRVFCNETEDENKIQESLVSLIPFDISEEKIVVKKKTSIGFKEKKIKILEIVLEKNKHVNAFLDSLNDMLGAEQKELLNQQSASRLDDELNFFIRFDKDRLLNKELWITESGDCFHLTISIAAFPSKKEVALSRIKEIFK